MTANLLYWLPKFWLNNRITWTEKNRKRGRKGRHLDWMKAISEVLLWIHSFNQIPTDVSCFLHTRLLEILHVPFDQKARPSIFFKKSRPSVSKLNWTFDAFRENRNFTRVCMKSSAYSVCVAHAVLVNHGKIISAFFSQKCNIW